MIDLRAFAIAVLFSAIFGGLLYLVTAYSLKKLGKTKVGNRKKRIWVWRITLLLTVVYMISVLMLNKRVLDLTLVIPLDLMLMAFLVVFFVTLVEIAVIELLLPDVIKLRYRIGVEVTLFFLISASSMLIFFLLSNMFPI